MAAIQPLSFNIIRWLFLRALGVIYLIAFVSAGTQILALVGARGISPIAFFLDAVQSSLGSSCYLTIPTLAWLNSSDPALVALCAAGIIAACLVLTGVLTVPALLACYLFYLSIVQAGQEFMSFQWDWLLLEAGFLALFFAPWVLLEPPWPAAKPCAPPSWVALWLLRILLFKLMFMSGLCKLYSHDPTWANLTALIYHYETQPLPTPLGWLAAQFPDWFQKLSVVIMFVIELAVPFLIFAGRRMRIIAAALIAMLQLLILATGNYTFFNWLTLALCLLLLDDGLVSRLVPPFLTAPVAAAATKSVSRAGIISHLCIALLILLLALVHVPGLGGLVYPLYSTLSRFGIYNTYGLFAVMTTERNEIIIEGSNDGTSWMAYEFPFKPGDLRRPPPFVAPFQPRLDWQLWFAALGTASENRWFGNLILRLLQGTPEVLALLAQNPFPEHPPRYIRASLFHYHFTDIPTLLKTGQWWHRTYAGEYFPAASLKDIVL